MGADDDARNTPAAHRDEADMRLAWERLSWYLAVALIVATVVGATVGLTGTAIGNGGLARVGGDAFGFALLVGVPLILIRWWISRRGKVIEAIEARVEEMAVDAAESRRNMDEALEYARELERKAGLIDARLEALDDLTKQLAELEVGTNRQFDEVFPILKRIERVLSDPDVIIYPRRR